MALRLTKVGRTFPQSRFDKPNPSGRGRNSSKNLHSSSSATKVSFRDEKVELDFDLLVSNVENSIMTDQQRAEKMYSSKDLLMKTNPGLFENIPDITNPREIYNFINRKQGKSLDDVSILTKSSYKDVTPTPKLMKATSMKDLRKAAGLKPISRREGYHSNQELNSLSRIDRKDPSVTALFINAPYLNLDDLKYLPDPSSLKRYQALPDIEKENDEPALQESNKISGNVPCIKSGSLYTSATRGGIRMENRKRRKILNENDTVEEADKQMDKWFSEIPVDVLEKAEKVLTEQNLNEAENAYNDLELVKGNRYHSRLKRRVMPFLKPIPSIPNKYLELRAPRSIDKDVNINRDQYKLKQRSLLRLKVLDAKEESKIAGERSPEHEIPTYKYNIERFYPTENKQTVKDLAKTKKQDGDGVKKISIDEFAIEAYDINPSEKFTFAAKPQNEEGATSALCLHKNKTSVDLNASKNSSHGFTRNNLRSSLSVDRVSGGNRDQKVLERTLTISGFESSLRKHKSSNDLGDIDKFSTVSSASSSFRCQSKIDGKEGRPPTRTSSQSRNHTREKKEVLRPKRLEVFPNNTSTSPEENEIVNDDNSTNPLIKFDNRRHPSRGQQRDPPQPPQQDLHHMHGQIQLLGRRSKSELPALTFQFNTGEVIITKNANGGSLSSESENHSTHSCYPKRDVLKPGPQMTQRIKSVNSKFESMEAMSLHSMYRIENTDLFVMAPDYGNSGEVVTSARSNPPPPTKPNTVHEIQPKPRQRIIPVRLEDIRESNSSEPYTVRNDVNKDTTSEPETKQNKNEKGEITDPRTHGQNLRKNPTVEVPTKGKEQRRRVVEQQGQGKGTPMDMKGEDSGRKNEICEVAPKVNDSQSEANQKKGGTVESKNVTQQTADDKFEGTDSSALRDSDATKSDMPTIAKREDELKSDRSKIKQIEVNVTTEDNKKTEEILPDQSASKVVITTIIPEQGKTSSDSSDTTISINSNSNPDYDIRSRDVATSMSSLLNPKSPRKSAERRKMSGSDDTLGNYNDDVFSNPVDVG